MGLLRWRWTLGNGGTVEASVDDAQTTETVAQAGVVLSQGPRNGKPGGHTVLVAPLRIEGGSDRPPIEATLTFASHAPICILRVEGHEVAPSLWPTRRRSIEPPEPDPPRNVALIGLAALGGIAILVLVTIFVTRPATASAPARLDGSLRALNGLFIAHYPEDMAQRVPPLPSGLFGVRLDDHATRTTIVLAAGPRDQTGADPWSIQQRMRDEVLANVKKVDETFEESSRRDETCAGEPGAVVAGALVESGKPVAQLWTCAVVHGDGGYVLVTRLGEPVSKEESKRARRIVDATELTKLGALEAAEKPTR